MTEPSTSFDSPWKDLVETYLPEFFAFFFPESSEAQSQVSQGKNYSEVYAPIPE